MATVEILLDSNGSSGLCVEQREDEVHLFSDLDPTSAVGWRRYRVGSPYELDGYQRYPFFIDIKEVQENGWSSVTIAASSDPPIPPPVFRVWFSGSDIDCLRRGTTEFLEIISLSAPMANDELSKEIQGIYRERILQVARDAFL